MARECLKDTQVKEVSGGFLTAEAQTWWDDNKELFYTQNPIEAQALETSLNMDRSSDTTLDELKQKLVNLGFQLPNNTGM